MTDDPINLVLEHLRALRADLGSVRETQMEHGMKLNRLEESLAGVKRDIALHAEHLAHIEVRLDQIRGRLGLIERRLELTEACSPSTS
ncbi:MAG: hypothetical protein AB7F22_20050 [Reyranella sp.]|uniref:hypothetical protein n=1 Tax=Reyranella sp. TaxID=1929291 RepID=UPI003D13C963